MNEPAKTLTAFDRALTEEIRSRPDAQEKTVCDRDRFCHHD